MTLEQKIELLEKKHNSTFAEKYVSGLREIARWAVEICVPIQKPKVVDGLGGWNKCREFMLSKAKELGILSTNE